MPPRSKQVVLARREIYYSARSVSNHELEPRAQIPLTCHRVYCFLQTRKRLTPTDFSRGRRSFDCAYSIPQFAAGGNHFCGV